MLRQQMARPDPEANRRSSREWGRFDALALGLLMLVAVSVRFLYLDDPHKLVFDETYYAKDACLYAGGDLESCNLDDAQVEAHPPLGKWLIGTGIAVFGFDSFGWRIAVAIAGSVSVALLYLLARRLFRSTFAACIAAGLFALDLLHVVQSRIAMLDVFVPLFGLAAVLFVVYDRDRPIGTATFFGRPWRIAAGVAAGCAAASKWSGITFILLVLVLSLGWEIAARRGTGERGAVITATRQEGVAILLWLILVPVLVYVLTYAGRADGSIFGAPWSEGSWLHSVGSKQVEMYEFHTRDLIDETHPYQSPAWTWILVKRPVSYFFEVTAAGDDQEVMAFGNPVVWWASILAIGYTVYRWLRNLIAGRRSGYVAFAGPEGVIVAGVALTYGPWLVQQTDRAAVFLFYLLPTVPFMCLALAYVASRISDSWEGRAAVAIFAVATIGLFVYFYPLLTKRSLAPQDWKARIWFEDCDAGTDVVETATSTQTRPGGQTIIRTTTTTTEEGEPTNDWCWI